MQRTVKENPDDGDSGLSDPVDAVFHRVVRAIGGMVGVSSLTEKRFLRILQFHVLIACLAIVFLVLSDVRLNIIGEPFTDHIQALSIAISRVVYDANGLVGFEQVFDVLMRIPNVSAIKLDSALVYGNYQQAINDALQKATLLTEVDRSRVHAYTNDQGYLYFVIAAFSLFGIKIQSLSYLWLSYLLLSVLVFAVAYRSKIANLLLLWCVLVSIFLLVVANPGVGKQLITVHNNRFLPILGMIPLLHVVLSMGLRQKNNIDWLLELVQIVMLVFVFFLRSSAQWMLIAVIFASLYSLIRYRIKANAGVVGFPVWSIARAVGLRVAPVVIVFACFVVIKIMLPKFLHKEYTKDLWASSHVVWHGAVIGLTVDPVLLQRYVCSDAVLTDQLSGFRLVQCKDIPQPVSRFTHAINARVSDMHGFQAAVKYLRERGSDEQVGAKILNPRYFHIKWARYDEIMGKVYSDMIRRNPYDLLYMYAVINPVRYFKEATMYVRYFALGLLKPEVAIGTVLSLFMVFALHLNLLRGAWRLRPNSPAGLEYELRELAVSLLGIFISSLALPILFFSQAHAISDSIGGAIALGMILSFCGMSRKWVRTTNSGTLARFDQ